MTVEVKPRRYHSPTRTAAARETRSRIVVAASQLFGENGYPATTIAAIARRAEVAPDTVYATFGGKLAVLKATMDVVVGGDEQDVDLLDRAAPQAMRAEIDQRRQIAMFAAGLTRQLERIAPVDAILRGAAAVDPAAAELRADLQLRQRRAAMRTCVSWIAANGPLRAGLTDDDAAAVVWTLTSPEVYAMYRDSWAWSADRYEDWLHETLLDALLPTVPG
jgi:AcrR family transcriptional regulator